jgi:hypothetical protein
VTNKEVRDGWKQVELFPHRFRDGRLGGSSIRSPLRRRKPGLFKSSVKEGKEHAQRKAREIRERAEDFVERGKQVVAEEKEIISKAVDAGRQAYQREKSKESI